MQPGILAQIVPGKYRHYKGGIYEVLFEATHTEDNTTCVVYKHLESGKIYVRPKLVFLSTIKVLREKTIPRFELIQE